jgi:hypothetical protein
VPHANGVEWSSFKQPQQQLCGMSDSLGWHNADSRSLPPSGSGGAGGSGSGGRFDGEEDEQQAFDPNFDAFLADEEALPVRHRHARTEQT